MADDPPTEAPEWLRIIAEQPGLTRTLAGSAAAAAAPNRSDHRAGWQNRARRTSGRTVAMAFGGYLRVFVDLSAPIAALLLLAGCTAFNIWGLRESSWVNICSPRSKSRGCFW